MGNRNMKGNGLEKEHTEIIQSPQPFTTIAITTTNTTTIAAALALTWTCRRWSPASDTRPHPLPQTSLLSNSRTFQPFHRHTNTHKSRPRSIHTLLRRRRMANAAAASQFVRGGGPRLRWVGANGRSEGLLLLLMLMLHISIVSNCGVYMLLIYLQYCRPPLPQPL